MPPSIDVQILKTEKKSRDHSDLWQSMCSGDTYIEVVLNGSIRIFLALYHYWHKYEEKSLTTDYSIDIYWCWSDFRHEGEVVSIPTSSCLRFSGIVLLLRSRQDVAHFIQMLAMALQHPVDFRHRIIQNLYSSSSNLSGSPGLLSNVVNSCRIGICLRCLSPIPEEIQEEYPAVSSSGMRSKHSKHATEFCQTMHRCIREVLTEEIRIVSIDAIRCRSMLNLDVDLRNIQEIENETPHIIIIYYNHSTLGGKHGKTSESSTCCHANVNWVGSAPSPGQRAASAKEEVRH